MAVEEREISAHDLVIYNLGCGTRASPACVNVDWSIHRRLRNRKLSWIAGSRAEKIRALPDSIVVHDLRKGIPAPSSSVDVVYHSHLLEHIGREDVPAFMREVLRVLKPGGVHRVVVPDFEQQTRRYVDAFGQPGHAERLAAIIDQLVRVEAAGTATQPRLRRTVENFLLGDARKRGEIHLWMYDRLTLPDLLRESGFIEPTVFDHASSSVHGWSELGLDHERGDPYKPGSLYVEARKPA